MQCGHWEVENFVSCVNVLCGVAYEYICVSGSRICVHIGVYQ